MPDYKPRASKSRNRARSRGATVGPRAAPRPWRVFAVGVLVGVGATLLAMRVDVDGLRAAWLGEATQVADAGEHAGTTPADERVTYEFYDILPESEVLVGEEELEALDKVAPAPRSAEPDASPVAARAVRPTTGDAPTLEGERTRLSTPSGSDAPAPVRTAEPSQSAPQQDPVGPRQVAATVSSAEAKTITKKPTYLLQVASFKRAADAEALRAKLGFLGLRAHVQVVSVDRETRHRVRVGPLEGAPRMRATRDALTRNGYESMVLKLRRGA